MKKIIIFLWILLLIITQDKLFAEEEGNINLLAKIRQLKEKDYCATLYLKTRGNILDDYFPTLDALYPLFKKKEWIDNIKGFYISHIGATLKLEWFTPNINSQLLETVKQFVTDPSRGLKIEREKYDPEPPILSTNYGGDEVEFRKFLSITTLIAVDIMKTEAGRNQIQEKVINARNRGRTYYRDYLQRLFETESPSYRLLLLEEKVKYWDCIKFYELGKDSDWMHMLVNMVNIAE